MAEEEMSETEEKYADIEQKLSEKMGTEVRILEPNGYTLAYANVRYDGKEEVRAVGLGYTVMDGEKELAGTEEEAEQIEERENSEFLYGPYKGSYTFRASIEPKDDEFDIESFAAESGGEIEVKEIAGRKVGYAEIEMMPRQLRAFIPFEDVLYSLVIPLEGEGTGISKENALNYIEQLIEEY